VRFNGEWLGRLSFEDVVRLASHMTVAQVLQREDFANRLDQHQPVSLHELLYPLAQAYDSVAIEADIEMGGQDQTFNILAGRDLQREEGQSPQVAFFMPLLVGLDGVKKMSKSLGNYVGIKESPESMFAKIMSISDEQMQQYFLLCTDVPSSEIDSMLAEASTGGRNPMEVKRRLAAEIVEIYHGCDVARAADVEWQRVHSLRQLPASIPETALDPAIAREGKVWICRLLVSTGLMGGTGEARRAVQQGAVTLNGEKITSPDFEAPLESLNGAVLKVGPKKYARLVREQ
ncbi:MAG TPA: tyrosine--tRNA ligase, partial [Chthonomonadales bacterium]|nr:tyrosine--tRNA ligase [Chthonomonadales bacterium]